MPDTMGRIFQTAEDMRQFKEIDEPLVIHAHELAKVAEYTVKLNRLHVVNSRAVERMLRDGLMRVFGRRVHVLN